MLVLSTVLVPTLHTIFWVMCCVCCKSNSSCSPVLCQNEKYLVNWVKIIGRTQMPLNVMCPHSRFATVPIPSIWFEINYPCRLSMLVFVMFAWLFWLSNVHYCAATVVPAQCIFSFRGAACSIRMFIYILKVLQLLICDNWFCLA